MKKTKKLRRAIKPRARMFSPAEVSEEMRQAVEAICEMWIKRDPENFLRAAEAWLAIKPMIPYEPEVEPKPLPYIIDDAFQRTLERHREKLEKKFPKGAEFEDRLEDMIKSVAGDRVVIFRRNKMVDLIKREEYLKAPKEYRDLIDEADMVLYWNGKPQVVVEASHRKGFYWSPTDLKCGCEFKQGKHLSLPSWKLDSYKRRAQKFPFAKCWIIFEIGKEVIGIKMEDFLAKCFINHNPKFTGSISDNPLQAVVCLDQTPHVIGFAKWANAAGIPNAMPSGLKALVDAFDIKRKHGAMGVYYDVEKITKILREDRQHGRKAKRHKRSL